LINVRNKGKRGELEVVKIINKFLNTTLRRTPNSGGLSIKGDIIDTKDTIVHNIHFEIKNQSNIAIPKWWKQTTSDCSSNKVPILIFKHNNQWLSVLLLNDLLYFIKDTNNNQ